MEQKYFCAGSSNDSECGSDIAHGDPEGGTKAHPRMSAPKVQEMEKLDVMDTNHWIFSILF